MNVPTACGVIFCNPVGPSLPWGTPLLVLFDTARSLIMIGCLAVIVQVPRHVRRTQTSGQRSRLIAHAMFAIIVVDTEIDHFGDYASMRLPLSLVAIGYSIHGMWQLRHELAAQPRGRAK